MARVAYYRAIEILEDLNEKNPNETQFQVELTRVLVNLGALALNSDDKDSARTAFEKSIRIAENLARTNPNLIENRSRLARALTNLGDLESRVGNPVAARAAIERSITLNEDLMRRLPGVPEFAAELGRAYGNLSILLIEPSDALARILLAIDLQQRALTANPRDLQYRKLMADHLTRLEKLVSSPVKAGEFDKAISRLNTLVTNFPNIPEFGSSQARLAGKQAWMIAADPGRDKDEYEKAMELAGYALKADIKNGRMLNTLGVAQYRSGKLTEAATTLAKSTESKRQAPEAVEQPADLAFLAMTQWKLGKEGEATATYGRLAESMKRAEFAKDPESRQFFREATNLLYPMTLPEDPFQSR